MRRCYPKVNQTVHVYAKFLERRAALVAHVGTDDAVSEGKASDVARVELFLCSELQRNHDLHSALALTADPAEVCARRRRPHWGWNAVF